MDGWLEVGRWERDGQMFGGRGRGGKMELERMGDGQTVGNGMG